MDLKIVCFLLNKESCLIMSRATQFIDYINKDKEAEPVIKLTEYTSLVIDKEVQEARKKYRKKIKESNETG